MASSSYDLIDLTSLAITRGVTAAAAATALGVTEEALTSGVAAASFLDGGGVRAVGYFGVWGDDYEYRWGVKAWGVGFTTRSPVIGRPALAEVE